MRKTVNTIFGMALTLGLACGFADEAKKAPATPVDNASISAESAPMDADCEKAMAEGAKGKDCPKGSKCAKAHAKGGHAAVDCPKGAEHCDKHKAGEAKAVPGKSGTDKPEAKPAEPAKAG